MRFNNTNYLQAAFTVMIRVIKLVLSRISRTNMIVSAVYERERFEITNTSEILDSEWSEDVVNVFIIQCFYKDVNSIFLFLLFGNI